MEKSKQKWMDFVEISFLNNDFKAAYKELISNRFERLNNTN